MKPQRLFFAAAFLLAGCQQPVGSHATPNTSVQPLFDETRTESGGVVSTDTADAEAVANGWIGGGH